MILPLVELYPSDMLLLYHHEAMHHSMEMSPELTARVLRSLKSHFGISFFWLKSEAGTENKVQNLYWM